MEIANQSQSTSMSELEIVQSHAKDLRESYKKRIPQDAAYRQYQLKNMVTPLASNVQFLLLLFRSKFLLF